MPLSDDLLYLIKALVLRPTLIMYHSKFLTVENASDAGFISIDV